MSAKEEYHAAYRAMEEAGEVALKAGKHAQSMEGQPGFEEAKKEFEAAYQVYYDAVQHANSCRSKAWQEALTP
jgi:hypothetical protein